MAAAQSSSLLLDNVNKILSTFIPMNSSRDGNQLYSSIGVKSHGTITFSDNKSNRAEFIRVPPDASVMRVKELLYGQWCGERPSLVISVTGGAKEYNMKPKILRAFQRGLLKVARTTGAWIITGGMNTGIMKLVGEIVQIYPDRSRPIHLIGIATWGCVSDFEQLDVHGSDVKYARPRSNQKGEAPLESNHTEFIFVDDGSVRKYGREIPFRAKLERAISGGFFASKYSSNSTNQYTSLTGTPSLRTENPDTVPVVLLVVEGGPNTVRTVHEAVVQNNIPAVFLEGTGRCCDLFAKAFHLYNEHRPKIELSDEAQANNDPSVLLKRNEELKNKLREELKEQVAAISLGNDGAASRPARKTVPNAADQKVRVDKTDNTDYFELVYECIHTRTNFLNVISLNSRNPVEPDIDLAILQALLNATSGNDSSKTKIQRKHEQLLLALEWNRVDIAKNFIMKENGDWENIDLNGLFALALDRNQIDFVKLFLDHDFSLTDLFRNNEKLQNLYRNDVNYSHHFANDSDDPLRTIYKKIIQPLIGDFFEVDVALPLRDSNMPPELIDEIEGQPCLCCGPRTGRSPSVSNHGGSVRSEGSTAYSSWLMDVDKELFLWSVLTNRRDLALLFWSRGKNKICVALMGAVIYRKLAHKDKDSSNNYNQAANDFESFAVQILDKFYQANTRACTKAIFRQIPAYGNATWLELAIAAEAKQFISHRAVQDVLKNIWYGYIDPRVGDKTIIFSTAMLWFSGFLRYNNELVKVNDEGLNLDEIRNKNHILQTQNSQQQRVMNRPINSLNMSLLPRMTDVDDIPTGSAEFGCWEKTKTAVSRYFSNIIVFMRAPYVKYLYNLYFHVIFLLLFCYVILCDFFPLYDYPVDVCSPASKLIDHGSKVVDDDDSQSGISLISTTNKSLLNRSVPYGFQRRAQPSVAEWVLVSWVVTLLCEELRQLFTTEAQSRRNAVIAYLKIFWNKLDVVALILFFVAFGLRFAPTAQCFCAARILLSVDLTIWFMRSLDIFAAVQRLGPKLVMIGEMAHDLKFFMIMLTVFILAFGASSYSLIYGVQEFSWHLPRDIINLAYWQIFGELNALETFEDDYKPNGYAVFILLVSYMAIVSILLVNLLIAMFSNTFDRLQTDTDRIWKYQRYSLVCEYLSRPALPPPFIIFSHIWRGALFILARVIKADFIQDTYKEHVKRTKYKIPLGDKSITNIEAAEDALGDEVYYNFLKTGRKLVDETDLDEERVQSPQDNMLNRMRTLENRIQTMSNQQAHMCEYLECLMDGLKTMGGERIRVPERRRFDPDESLINIQVDDEPLLNTYHHPGYHSI